MPPIWLILPLLGLAVVVWQTVGLLQLKRFNRWLAVAFFGWFAISSAWGATISFRLPTIKPAPAFLIFFFLIATNLLCAWYLSRHTFREFAVSFVARRDKEKNARMMEEIARKRIQNENRR